MYRTTLSIIWSQTRELAEQRVPEQQNSVGVLSQNTKTRMNLATLFSQNGPVFNRSWDRLIDRHANRWVIQVVILFYINYRLLKYLRYK